MAKKELNVKKIVMEVILVLVLVIGIVLLLGVFGKNASTLNDIETSVANNSNKITNTKEELNKEIDDVLEDVIALETTTNNNYNKTKTQINNLKTETNKTLDDISNLLNTKTNEIITSVDNTRDTILLNNEELSRELSELISTEAGVVNANVNALRTDLLNVQTNLQAVTETVGGIVSGYLEKIIKDEVSDLKVELHQVGATVLNGVAESNYTVLSGVVTALDNHFTVTNGKIDTLETNLTSTINGVGATVLNGVAESNFTVLSGVVTALENNFTVTNGKIDALELSTTEVNGALSTLSSDLATAKSEILTKIGENYTLISDNATTIISGLSAVETKLGDMSGILSDMNDKLNTIISNTANIGTLPPLSYTEIQQIVDECSPTLSLEIITKEDAARCVLNKLGY